MRYQQLDSLRGLAACSVVLLHATNILPAIYDNPHPLWWLNSTPLALLRAGYPSVIFFFILSGYVLALPFLKGPIAYWPFIARRVCRIWIPYAAAMVVSIACALWFYPTHISGLSRWANQTVPFPSLRLLLNHVFLIGSFDSQTYNRVFWSLVYEMRISLIFPLLVLLLQLGAWWKVLGAAVTLSIAELAVERLPIWSGSNEFPMTLHYAGLFVVGMLLAREMPRLQLLFARLRFRVKALLFLLALLCYVHENWLLPASRLPHLPLYRDGLIALAVSFFIISAFSSSRISGWLCGRIPVFLGKISYSVYLYHVVILLSLLHCFYGKVPLAVIWTGAAVLTLLIALLSYHAIELPSIQLGRKICLEPGVPVSKSELSQKSACL
jgi:peptidoglycan/LPS O-acetylase OafA/YrhL